MNTPAPALRILLLVCSALGVALPAAAAPLSPADLVGTYSLRGTDSTVVIYVKKKGGQDQLEMTIDGEVRGRSRPGETRLHAYGGPFGDSIRELKMHSSGTSIRVEWNTPVATVAMHNVYFDPKPRVLLLPNHKENSTRHTRSFLARAKDLADYYDAQGYETQIYQMQGTERLIDMLRGSGRSGRTFSRVVFIARGDAEGPMLGEDDETIGPGSEEFPKLASALRWATTRAARVYVSSSKAGGASAHRLAQETSWTDALAQQSTRRVAGPVGDTNTDFTLAQVRAVLEEDGQARQETKLSLPNGSKRVVSYNGLISDAETVQPPSKTTGMAGLVNQ